MNSIPRYQSHKVVEALKIQCIELNADRNTFLLFFEPLDDSTPVAPHEVTGEWIRRSRAAAGGYWVKHVDGYESWSPAKAFEEGYTPIDESSFEGSLLDLARLQVRDELEELARQQREALRPVYDAIDDGAIKQADVMLADIVARRDAYLDSDDREVVHLRVMIEAELSAAGDDDAG